MHTLSLRSFVSVCIAACFLSLTAAARAADQAPPPPPQTQKLEEGEAPEITIRKPGVSEEPITQTKKQGKVTEVKVQSGGSTYYLKPNEQSGSALPGDVESSPMRGSQWQVLEFDMKPQKNQTQPEQAPNTPQPPAK
ncbi:MAG: DUF2782 domain-containing protein [Burkholderiaceae bacterium]